jgi:hypothetical protein
MTAAVLETAAGADFGRLPLAIREMHGGTAPREAIGRGDIERGAGLIARAIAALARLPLDGRDQMLCVRFLPTAGGERWVRRFGARGFASRLNMERGALVEQVYGLAVRMRAEADEAGLSLILLGARWCGVPLPRALTPRFTARISAPERLYRFEVSIELPFGGRLIRYAGWLAPPHNIDR